MPRRVTVSNTRIIEADEIGSGTRAVRTRSNRTVRPATKSTTDQRLAVKLAGPADLPWLQTWASELALPAPRSARVRSFLLMRDGQRVGYFGTRNDVIETLRGREPILWIVSAFLIPAVRKRGMILKFGEMISRDYYRSGKVGARVATNNTRMLKIMEVGGWKKLRSTRRYIDFLLEIDEPFRASR